MLRADNPTRLIRVLLVDDSSENGSLVQNYLKDTPHQVDVAQNSALAFERLQNGNYDLILMNIPQPGDATTATRIREWERIAGRTPLPIIALTRPSPGVESNAIQDVEFSACLTRPINRQALLDAMTRYGRYLPEPITRNIPASVKTLVPVYLSRRRTDLETLRSALAREDFPLVARIGHNLKGSGAPYGFPEITDIGRSLERSGKEQDQQQATRDLAELANLLDSVNIAP